MKIKNVRNSFIKNFLLIVSTAVFAVGMMAGCKFEDNKASANNSYKPTDSNTAANRVVDQEKIMEQYQSLLKNNASLAEIVKFMDGNVSQVSSNNAVMIVDEFEKRQKEFLPEFEKNSWRMGISKARWRKHFCRSLI